MVTTNIFTSWAEIRSLFDELSQLERECFGGSCWGRSFWKRLADNGCFSLFVIFEKRSLIAFLVCSRSSDEVEILRIGVKSGFRGKDIGSSLFQKMKDSVGTLGAKRLFLEVRESNRSAIRFYGKMGFKRIGRRSGYYKHPTEDAINLSADI